MSHASVPSQQKQKPIAPMSSDDDAITTKSRVNAPAIFALIILVALATLAVFCTGAQAKTSQGATSQAAAPQTAESHQPLDREKWEARMHLPSDSQISSYETDLRSPYLVCWPEFPGKAGYSEYAVDFKADSQPRGTYVNIGSWWMDLSNIDDRFVSLESDDGGTPGCCYAGFQILEDGSKVAILSVWNIYAVDANGKTTVIHATRTYPDNPRVGGKFGGEGTGIQTIVEYDWQAGRTYRALIQCGQTESGNCELTFWVCDLTTGQWDKLAAYDLGYGNTSILSIGCFLENFATDYAAEIRTTELSNFRANSLSEGGWVSATSALWERQFETWPGSYAYGSDDSCFWAVTSGIPNLCEPSAGLMRFTVDVAEEGAPRK